MANFTSERELKDWVGKMGRQLGWNEKARDEVFAVMNEFRSGYGIREQDVSKMFKKIRLEIRDKGLIGHSSYEKLKKAIGEMYGETVDKIEDTTE